MKSGFCLHRNVQQVNPGVIYSPDASNPHHTKIAESESLFKVQRITSIWIEEMTKTRPLYEFWNIESTRLADGDF
jgi:hypothetical protein